MKLKKTITGLLAVTVLSTSAVTAFATNVQNVMDKEDIGRIIPISAPIDVQQQRQVGSITGKVKEIRDFMPIEGSKFVSLENEEGEIIANIIVSDDTYILNDTEITLGSTVTGYYDANAPMILIYPPQYNVEVLVVENEEENVKVDIFDENLVSSDNTLKLNISDDTEIILQDGKAFDGELVNRKLVVTYGASTKSIPAQTTPSKIVVLFEKAEHPIYELTEEEKQQFTNELQEMAANADIMVEGKKIDAPSAYMTDERVIMVPLRGIAEALGFEVTWEEELQRIMVGKGISLTIGENYYTYMKTAPIELECAPQLVEDKTFVPINFFKEVAKMNNAYMFEGQIVIDNGEIME